MKNIRKLFCAIALILTAFSFTACELFKDAVADLAGPVDTWCEMKLDIKGTTVLLDLIYVDEAYTGTETGSKNAVNLKKGLTIKPGITMVVTLDQGEDGDRDVSLDAASLVGSMFEGLSDTAYFYKNFPASSASYDDADGSFSFAGSQLTWTTLYRLRTDMHDTSTQAALPQSPFPLTVLGQKYMQPIDGVKFRW